MKQVRIFKTTLILFFIAMTVLFSCTQSPKKQDATSCAPSSVSEDRIKELESYLFQGNNEDKTSLRTDAVKIVHNGCTVYERYSRDFLPEQKHMTWSIGKSFLHVLIGRAIKDGILNLNDSACKHLPTDVKPGFRCDDLTIQDLLQMRSGLKWYEGYEGTHYTKSSVIKMLHSPNMGEFVAGHEQLKSKSWAYSSGDTNLLAFILKEALRKNGKNPDTYAWTELFEPLKMPGTTIEKDSHGTFVFSSHAFATADALAKFGEFLLQFHKNRYGKSNSYNEYIQAFGADPLSNNFHKVTFEAPREISKPLNFYPGTHFRLNHKFELKDHGPFQTWPGLPESTFAAAGHHGQFVIVIPDWDLVIVRLGDTKGDYDVHVDVQKLSQLAHNLVTKNHKPATFSPPIPSSEKVSTYQSYSPLPNILYRLKVGNQYVAKQMCSCLFVESSSSQINPSTISASYPRCRNTWEFPKLAPLQKVKITQTEELIFLEMSDFPKPVKAKLKIPEKISFQAIAQFDRKNPQWGCRLAFYTSTERANTEKVLLEKRF